jgi:vacuolar-type H+-ATPase subunit E/Vma4
VALDRILKAIEADAEVEIARITAEAEARCAALRAQAEAAAARTTAARRARAGEELARLRTAAVAEADVDVLRALSLARAEIANEALSELRGRLQALRDDPAHSARITAALLREGLERLPGAAIIRVDRRDGALAAEVLAALGACAAVEATLTTWGGGVLDDRLGRTLDNTLEARLGRMEPELSMILSREIPALWRGHP